MADWQVVLQLAKVMKSPMRYSSLHDVVEEIEKLVPLYSEMGYVESAAGGARTNGAVASRRLYKGHFPTGFGQFMPVHHVPRDGRSSDGYPLTLLTGTVLYGFVNGARSSRSHRLHSFAPRGYVELCPDDAERIGIGHGDRVKVISAKGELETLARRTKSLPQGVLFMPSCFPSEPVGNLFPTTLDPWSKTPSVKSCAVRLERIDANEGYERAKDS
jgi:formate dehydrogenase major subunit/formate dehydrogenase alpha subunit